MSKQNKLSFETLRKANLLRLPQFKNKHGDIVHFCVDGSDWSPSEWLESVLGELGEFANIQKKLRRGDLTREEAIPLLQDELADTVTYIDILASQYDIDLGGAIVDKFNRVSDRVSATTKISKDGSKLKSA